MIGYWWMTWIIEQKYRVILTGKKLIEIEMDKTLAHKTLSTTFITFWVEKS